MNKITKGIFASFLVFAFVLVAAKSASAAYSHTTTLKMGSTGTQVMELQKALNGNGFLVSSTGAGSPGMESTYFGSKTKAAVMAYQSAKGLTSDGVVGPMTGASIAALTGGSTGGGSTGLLCPNGMTLASNCTMAPGSTPAPQALCPNGMTLASNCTMAPGSTNTGPLQGGAGDITVTELSTPSSSTKVGEGESNVKVLGMDIEADDGSDVAINSMRVSLEHTSGSGNDKLNRYATEVSVWMGSTKVGSAPVSEFSESSGVYTKSINLSNAIVRAGKTEKFYIAVSAIADIDSGNTGSSNNTWTATLLSTRFTDATGVVLVDSTGSIANTHIYDTLASTQDVELKVNLSSSTPSAKTVKVSTTTDTYQVELMKFTMKAQGSKMYIDQIPVSFTSSNVESGGVDSITSNVTLKIGDKTFNESVSTAASAVTIDFDDLGIELSEGETINGTILADINDIEGGSFGEGNDLYAAITSSLVTTTGSGAGALDVEDSNGDQLVSGDRSGSAIGNVMTFRSTGVNVEMGTVTYDRTTDTNGNVTSVKYTIPVSVTSFGNTLYIGQSAQLATAATASNAFAVVVETAAAPTSESTSATTSITFATTNATIETNGFRLDDGQTKNFTITVNLLAATDNTSHRIRIDTIRTFTNAGLSGDTATNSDLLPVENYRTGFQFINN